MSPPLPTDRSAPLPTEAQEQRLLVQYLELLGLAFTHVPNGELRDRVTGARLKAAGVRAGVPDVLVFTPAPARPGARGVAIELKCRDGGRVSSAQKAWISTLEACGWVARVCAGFDEARAFLDDLGWQPASRRPVIRNAPHGGAQSVMEPGATAGEGRTT